MSGGLRCDLERTLVPLQHQVRPQEAERKGNVTNREQHPSPARLAPPSSARWGRWGSPILSPNPPEDEVQHCEGKGVQSEESLSEEGRRVVRGRGWEDSRKRSPAEEEELPKLVGRGCPHSGQAQGTDPHTTLDFALPVEKDLWDCVSLLTGHIRVFATRLKNICLSSE